MAKKFEQGFYLVTVLDGGKLELEKIEAFKPHTPEITDTEVTTKGVISVQTRCGRLYAAAYYPYEKGKCLNWSGRVLINLDRVLNGLEVKV